MLLSPDPTPPLSQTVTPSRTPSPSSVTYFMDGLIVSPASHLVRLAAQRIDWTRQPVNVQLLL